MMLLFILSISSSSNSLQDEISNLICLIRQIGQKLKIYQEGYFKYNLLLIRM